MDKQVITPIEAAVVVLGVAVICVCGAYILYTEKISEGLNEYETE